jgi:hypothetical protein
MVDEKKVQIIPFHALNEFMRDDYRLSVLQEVMTHFEDCDKDKILRVNRLFVKGVQIPGFRNSSLAPVAVRVKQSVSLFEKSPEFAALIIECWSERHQPLKETVWQLLETKNWKPLPVKTDRTQLPGFMVNWPKGDTFDLFINSIKESNPELNESDDNVSLMVVWVGNKLPYNLFEEPETDG